MGEIPERLARVRRAIGSALARAGDPAREVTIVAVTKTHPASVVDEVAAAGITDIGESRVQEAAAKMERALAEVRWHLVGHLQRNKARRAAELFHVIHSVDSPALVEALAATGLPLQVFLQVNVAREARKHGVRPEGARGLLQAALRATALEVLGLMTIPPLEEDPRPSFRALRELRDDLESTGDGPPLRALSMGMSSDFEAAIEEGATHIRLGTVLFGARAP